MAKVIHTLCIKFRPTAGSQSRQATGSIPRPVWKNIPLFVDNLSTRKADEKQAAELSTISTPIHHAHKYFFFI
jgi:hypothetical protein